MSDINAVVHAYIGTLLWSESCNGTAPVEVCDHLGRGEDCDASLDYLNYDADDLDDSARLEIVSDVTDFVEANAGDLAGIDAGDIGHNFVLSRNGHGAGFWDRGWGERGDRLHEAAKVYGTMSAYVGSDNKIFVQG
jgi:hypothetical protein